MTKVIVEDDTELVFTARKDERGLCTDIPGHLAISLFHLTDLNIVVASFNDQFFSKFIDKHGFFFFLCFR